jgi:hypothetical protein
VLDLDGRKEMLSGVVGGGMPGSGKQDRSLGGVVLFPEKGEEWKDLKGWIRRLGYRFSYQSET